MMTEAQKTERQADAMVYDWQKLRSPAGIPWEQRKAELARWWAKEILHKKG